MNDPTISWCLRRLISFVRPSANYPRYDAERSFGTMFRLTIIGGATAHQELQLYFIAYKGTVWQELTPLRSVTTANDCLLSPEGHKLLLATQEHICNRVQMLCQERFGAELGAIYEQGVSSEKALWTWSTLPTSGEDTVHAEHGSNVLQYSLLACS